MFKHADCPLVCVTGATGFIGSHVTSLLLKRGYKTRLLLRPESRTSFKEVVLEFMKQAESGQLELVNYDIFNISQISKAIKGAEYVIHTASNYAIDVENPQRELVDIAVKGTTNLLTACENNSATKKFIFTSSVAAVSDCPNGQVLDETHWNNISTLKRNPYYLAKTLAEKAVWERIEKKDLHFNCVSINPSMTIGPAQSSRLNESNKVIRDLINGGFPGIVNFSWNLVDVRDVANAHVRAIEITNSKGRYLCTNDTLHMREVVAFIKANGYSGSGLPSKRLDSYFMDKVIKLFSYLEKHGKGSYIRTHLGGTPMFTNRKIINDFGLTFRNIDETLLETISDLIRWGHLKLN